MGFRSSEKNRTDVIRDDGPLRLLQKNRVGVRDSNVLKIILKSLFDPGIKFQMGYLLVYIKDCNIKSY